MSKKPADPQEDDVEAMVTLSDADVGRIKSVAKSLRGKGFEVSHVLDSSGIIAGKAKPSTFEALRKVKGVAALEMSGDVDIGPPGADPS